MYCPQIETAQSSNSFLPAPHSRATALNFESMARAKHPTQRNSNRKPSVAGASPSSSAAPSTVSLSRNL
ncbi:hypothetical protein SDJN02_11814, partial [Cucurbita argyrosperma subsp. argyrosperma]